MHGPRGTGTLGSKEFGETEGCTIAKSQPCISLMSSPNLSERDMAMRPFFGLFFRNLFGKGSNISVKTFAFLALNS